MPNEGARMGATGNTFRQNAGRRGGGPTIHTALTGLDLDPGGGWNVHSRPTRGRPRAHDREAFFLAAWELLAERGGVGLPIAGLCERVGVTKGSFYSHFEDLTDFHSAFAARWEAWAEHTFRTYGEQSDLRRRFELTANTGYALVGGSNHALRAWAHSNAPIAAAMQVMHRSLDEFASTSMAEMAEDRDAGMVLATMAMAIAHGIQLRPQALTPEHFLRLVSVEFRAFGIRHGLDSRAGRTHLTVDSWGSMSLRSGAVTPLLGPPPVDPTDGRIGSGKSGTDTKSRYFAAALDLLAEGGADAITIVGLAQRLDLSKGSFQHHFGSMPRFLAHLAAHRESGELAQIDDCLAARDPLRRLELLHADLLLAPGPIQTGWRAWGHTDPVIGRSLRRVDQRRQYAIASTLRQIHDHPDCEAMAELALAFALGLHQRGLPPDPARTTRAATEFMHRFLGVGAEVAMDAGAPTLVLSRA